MQNRDSLTDSHPLPRSFWLSAAFTATFFVLFGAWVLLKENPSMQFARQMGIGLILSSAVSFIISIISSSSTASSSKIKPQSLLRRLLNPFTIFLLFQVLGNIGYVLNYWNDIQTYPTWADALALSSNLALFFGLWRLPLRSLARSARKRILLDSFILIVAMITFSWYFTLGPTILAAANSTPLAALTSIAFPACDLLLLCSVVLFAAFLPTGKGRLALSLLSISLVAFVLSDSAYTFRMLQQTYTPGWPDLGWIVAMLLLALATQMTRWLTVGSAGTGSSSEQTSSMVAAPLWLLLLPYLLVPAVLALIVYAWNTSTTSPLSIGTYCCGLFLLLVVFLRQLFSLRETRQLNQHLQSTHHLLQQQQTLLHEKNEALERANGRLEQLATTDPLTELPNHRALLATLMREQERASRYQRPYSLLFFDLDHFKSLNDGCGHAAGDAALFVLGQLLAGSVRDLDVVGRWGGEEFLAILPETEACEALEIAERLRRAVCQQPFAVGGGLSLTCSIGVASYPAHGQTYDTIINAADQAMYAAKRLGRNQVRATDDPAVQLLLTSETDEGSREERMLLGFVDALCRLIEKRDHEIADHSVAVAQLVLRLALHMGIPDREAQMISLAGRMHDLGKVSLPDTILQKPSRLTAQEWQQIKQHPAVGAEILAPIPSLSSLAPMVRTHHERWDGMGYPDQLKGEQIPFAARLISVVDAYMAMTVDRPYQQACPPEEALAELERCAGTQFDPVIVHSFIELLATTGQSAKTLTPPVLLPG